LDDCEPFIKQLREAKVKVMLLEKEAESRQITYELEIEMEAFAEIIDQLKKK